jgi:Metallo-peptidase family M12B Reprolysin-like
MKTMFVIGVFIACLWVSVDAFAQQAMPLVRRAAVTTPPVINAQVVRQQAVDVTPSTLSDPERSQVLQLDLFPDVSFVARRSSLAATAHGVSWVGVLDGYPDSRAAFVSVGDELIGHLYTPFGFFRIKRGRDAGYAVQQVDSGRRQDDIAPPPDAQPGRSVFGPSAAGNRVGTLALPEDSGAVIDVMVMYTRQALDGFGSEARVLAVIDLLVTEANDAFQNSRIPTRLRLVYTGVIDYAESGDSVTDINRLSRPNDGFLDDVHALRDRYAADLVMLITEKLEGGVEGRAYVSGAKSTGDLGFAVMQRSGTEDGTTFAHEIGHNLGFNHDWYVTAAPGAFDYSKGYVSLPGRFLDVMAYWNLCLDTHTNCTQLLSYSNSTMKRDGYPEGVRPGTNVTCSAGDRDLVECDADNAATATTMAAVVARFRNSQTGLLSRQILPGRWIDSDNGWFRLIYRSDGNLVLIDTRSQIVLWATNTGGTTTGQVLLQSDGNLVVLDAAGVKRWESGTVGNPNAYLIVRDDGNLVISALDGQAVWASRR